MDSLANYGSDDEYEENNSEKMGTPGHGGSETRTIPEIDANYDEVQMDLSEESNNNNSAEDDDQSKAEKSIDKKRRSRSREDSRSSKSNRHRRDRSEDRSRKDEDRSRKDEDRSRKHDSKSKYDKESNDNRYERKSSRDDKSGKRDDKRKYRRSSSRERRRSISRDRRRSNSRERNRRSGSRDNKRRSGSKERRRSRSPRRNDHRRRSSSKERGGSSRYGKRFDRTSNKIAQLEKLGIEIKTPDAEFVTPQMLLQRSMDEQVQKIKNSTGIELPKYYNPVAMNPARYADQIQKRRLLWQKKDAPEEAKPLGKVWEQTTFAQDSDGRVASKFKRLMGIKDNAASSTKDGSKDILKKQEEMFSSMEQQYEVARTATHTMRGVGLGFGTYNNYPR